ncbi:MAG: 50S ribosomal protein L6 [Candidatus Aenigmarchaeota archaeon]|nr:50S ribosomal protein L6 [Candidatus Aenigmarchaeota archaeon]
MPEKAVQIPSGIEVRIEKKELIVKGPKGELCRSFFHPSAKLEIKEGTVVFSSDSNRKKDRAVVGTWASHFRNMCLGVSKGWETRLKIVYSHFPMKVNVEGSKVIIGNFLGERKNREADIVGKAKVEVSKDEIIITGIDKEQVGNTAANIERAAKVQGFDRRIFQDGCHLIQKAKPMEK